MHLARALVANPEVLVMQKPTSHFDLRHGHLVTGGLRAYVDERGLELPAGEAQRKPSVSNSGSLY